MANPALTRRRREMMLTQHEKLHLHEEHGIGYVEVPWEEMSGYTYLTNSMCISRDALVLYGFLIENDGNNCLVHFHEGRNALMPVIMAAQSLANTSLPFNFPIGIELDNGLFVDFDGCTTSVCVLWRPRYEREAG